MADDVRLNTEYTLHVTGRGFIGGAFADTVVEDQADARIFPTLTEATHAQHILMRHYRTLGAPDIANDVNVLTRTTTTHIPQWQQHKAHQPV